MLNFHEDDCGRLFLFRKKALTFNGQRCILIIVRFVL